MSHLPVKTESVSKRSKISIWTNYENRKESDNIPIGDITHQEFIKIKEAMLNTGIPYEGWLFKDVFEVLSIDKQNKIIGKLLNSFLINHLMVNQRYLLAFG
ncbi:hypothetical protein J4727_05785 [Providencia rettgeri]|uniref:Uncharacterized protein n=1 Tax=Providencia rettgeri TaxID=587 RepID=A0A939NFZ3_PRORE|nr:hypothetical protein [Providencia rettgeri]